MRRKNLSLIISNFNKGPYLRLAVESALKESVPGLEILVVDDASTDESWKLIWDLPVRLIRLDKNQGQARAQNVGLDEAKGKLIAFLDSDDLLADNGLKWRWKELQKESFVAGPIAGLIDEKGRSLDKTLLYPKASRLVTWNAYKKSPCLASQAWTWACDRALIQKVGYFDESLQCAHDHDYLCRLLKVSDLHWFANPTVFYRLYKGNLSGEWKGKKYRIRPKFLAETLFVNQKYGVNYAPHS